ncbi:MAG: hypothetical protein AAFR84_07595 [Pseudomonadota bacterium]
MRIVVVTVLLALIAGKSPAISIDATNPAILEPAPIVIDPVEPTDEAAPKETLGQIAAAGAPEFPVPMSLLLFAAGLAGIIVIHRRPVR